MDNSFLSNKTYDRLKWAVQILLPACGALYFGVSQLWGLPKAEEVVGTLALFAIFIGTLIGISSRNFEPKDGGDIVVSENEAGAKVFSIELNSEPEEIENFETVTFNIVRRS